MSRFGKSWKRVAECCLCGKDRCVVNTNNESMGYCFRMGETFFVNKETGQVQGRTKATHQQKVLFGRVNTKKSKKENPNQNTFDFDDDDFDPHLGAISL